MKYAYIENAAVKEIFQASPHALFNPAYAAQFIEVPDEVQQGWIETGGTFAAPAVPPILVPIPDAVTMRQARLALLGAGVLDTADATIAAMTGVEGQAARISWEYAQEVRRDDPLIAHMASALGLTTEQLDALFTAASML